jgi:DNA-binding NtrC family response regulator
VLTGKGPVLQLKALGLVPQDRHPEPAEAESENEPPALTPEGLDLAERLQSFERHYIEQALKIARGNESKAARLLNMNHHTFRYRKKKLLGE